MPVSLSTHVQRLRLGHLQRHGRYSLRTLDPLKPVLSSTEQNPEDIPQKDPTMMSSSLYAGSLLLLPWLAAKSYCSTAAVCCPVDLHMIQILFLLHVWR